MVNSSEIKFSYHCGTSRVLEYCIDCYNCENCFGCVGLNRKEFHILNKEYGEEDYYKLVDQIKEAMLSAEEYVEFFPLSMATSYFPDSEAVLYFGAEKTFGQKLGTLEFEPESFGAVGEELSDTSKMKEASLLPDSIDDLKDEDWLGIPIWDAVWQRRFALIKPEIEYYRKHRLGPPRRHFISRMQSCYLKYLEEKN